VFQLVTCLHINWKAHAT